MEIVVVLQTKSAVWDSNTDKFLLRYTYTHLNFHIGTKLEQQFDQGEVSYLCRLVESRSALVLGINLQQNTGQSSLLYYKSASECIAFR